MPSDRNAPRLSRLAPGSFARLEAVAAHAPRPLVHRLMALGFTPGTLVRVVRRAPFGDPTEYELRGSRICLRSAEADLFTVSPCPEPAPAPALQTAPDEALA